jgi:DNA-binding XRE family transcriptional regulator
MNNLKEIRNQKKMAQEKLARLVDVSLRTIQNIENKNYEPGVYLALRIKKALEVKNIEELFNIDN